MQKPLLTITITITLLLSLTLGNVVFAKDYQLVKTADDAKVFLVKEGRRIHIPNPSVFEAGGYKWDEIETVSDTSMNSIRNTALIKSPVDAKVYLISDGKKQWIPNEETFLSTGFAWSDIVLISQAQVDFYTGESFSKDDATKFVEEKETMVLPKSEIPAVSAPVNASPIVEKVVPNQPTFQRPQEATVTDLGRKQVYYNDHQYNTQYDGEGIASLLLTNNGDVVVRYVSFKNKNFIESTLEDGSLYYTPKITYNSRTTVKKDGVVIREFGEKKVDAYNEKSQYVTDDHTQKKALFDDGMKNIEIPDIKGPQGMNVFDMNNNGMIVGMSTVVRAPGEDSPTHHAFVYQNGISTDITPFTLYGSKATAVNDAGQVAGHYNDQYGVTKAFVWNDGKMTILSSSKMTKGQAIDITEGGIVLGREHPDVGTCVKTNCSEWGFWENGVFQHVSDGMETIAMNDTKEVVGIVHDSYLQDNVIIQYPIDEQQHLNDDVFRGWLLRGHAVVYTMGRLLALDDIVKDKNILFTTAIDINNRGEILAYGFDFADISIHAYLIQLPDTVSVSKYPPFSYTQKIGEEVQNDISSPETSVIDM